MTASWRVLRRQVGVAEGHLDVGVAHQLLDDLEADAADGEVAGEGVAEVPAEGEHAGVAADELDGVLGDVVARRRGGWCRRHQFDQRRARRYRQRRVRRRRQSGATRPVVAAGQVHPPCVQRAAIHAVRPGPAPDTLAAPRRRRQAAPRISLIRDLPSLGHRFLLGTVEALDPPRRCHPVVVDGSPRTAASPEMTVRSS